MAHKKFTQAFKLEAVALVTQQGYSVAEACRALDVGDTAMRRWLKQYADEQRGITPKSKAMTPEHYEIQQLRARIKRLEVEKAILKKATALMAEIDIPSISG
jgi:transposase